MMSDPKKRLEVGDKVTWMDTFASGGGFSFRTKNGVVTEVGEVAVRVRLGNGRRKLIHASRLTPAEEKNQVTRVFEAIAGQEVGSKQRTQAQ